MAGPTAIVVDASVAVKWFSEEQFTEAAVDVRDAHAAAEVEIWAPDLFLFEMANALRFNPALDSEDVTAGIRSLFQLNLTFVTPQFDPPLVRTIDAAFREDLSVYDASYLALADVLDTIVLTADEELAACDRAMLVTEF